MTRLLASFLLALPLWLLAGTATTQPAEYEFFNVDAVLDSSQMNLMCPDLYTYDLRCFSLNMPRMFDFDRADWEQAYNACLATGKYSPEVCIGSVIVDGEF